jgi:3-deoxy-D-manno-octulosonic-acid transferase
MIHILYVALVVLFSYLLYRLFKEQNDKDFYKEQYNIFKDAFLVLYDQIYETEIKVIDNKIYSTPKLKEKFIGLIKDLK